MAEIAPVSEVPGGPPSRFDTGDPDPSTHPVIGFGKGLLLVVVHGPVVVNGVEWYLLTPAGNVIDVPTGWAAIRGPGGTPSVVSSTAECPVPASSNVLALLDYTVGLIACYGDQELTITDELACGPASISFAVGPAWLSSGSQCAFDAPFTVYGLPAKQPNGRYAVTGHFDDPESWTCRPGDGSTSSLDRLLVILECRRGFVATSVRAA